MKKVFLTLIILLLPLLACNFPLDLANPEPTRKIGPAFNPHEPVTPQQNPTLPELVAPQQNPLSEETPACTQWYISGAWSVTQLNEYHPIFEITQSDVYLDGTATLSEEEATKGGYSNPVGTGTGTLIRNKFTFVVTWQKADGAISGVYSGIVSEGGITGTAGNVEWSATGGTAECVSK